MKFVCINLKKSEERARLISAQSSSLDLKLDFYEAVDGSCMSYSDSLNKGYNRKRRLLYNNDLSINEIACSLSHLGAIREFLDSKYEYVVIMEDDVRIDIRISDFLSEFIERCEGWDVLKLEHRPSKKDGFTIGKISGFQVLIPGRPGFGAAGMLYNKAGARKILKAYSNFHKAFDSQFVDSWKHGIRVVQVYPGLIFEADLDVSTIGETRRKAVIESKSKKFFYMFEKLLSSVMKRIYSVYIWFIVKVK